MVSALLVLLPLNTYLKEKHAISKNVLEQIVQAVFNAKSLSLYNLTELVLYNFV